MIILKKRAARRASARTHQQLMAAAHHVVSRSALELGVEQARAAEVVALVFGRHALRIDESEALDYLNAVLAERGYPLHSATEPEVDGQ